MQKRSLAMVIVATLGFVSTIYFAISNSERNTATAFVAPTGKETPEGAACDLVRAYLHEDFAGFKEVTRGSACETPLDVARSFSAFLQYMPHHDASPSQRAERPTRIVKVHSAQHYNLRPCQQQLLQFDIMINDGAEVCMYVDVVTADNHGNEFSSRVEVVRTGNEDGQWRASFNENRKEWLQKMQLSRWVCPS